MLRVFCRFIISAVQNIIGIEKHVLHLYFQQVTECMCDCADAALGETVVVETESAPLPAPPQPVMPQVFNKPAPPPAYLNQLFI